MKKIVPLLLLLFYLLPPTRAGIINPVVDKRVEIMSIVARLAEYDEYTADYAVNYVKAIHAHFDAYKNAPVIQLAKQVREKNSIGFDAVMSMAINLVQQGDSFVLHNNWRENLDKRWKSAAASQWPALLSDFYKTSHAADFFEQEAGYYADVKQAFTSVTALFDQSWYAGYYGMEPKDLFTVIIGCGNGGANYGPSTDFPGDGHHIYAIMGSWSFDSLAKPVFKPANYLPTLVHEFNHSFINPLLTGYENNSTLKKSARKILSVMKEEMASQAYGDWTTLINESLVRASVVRYQLRKGSGISDANDEIMMQVNRGFLWTRELVDLLGRYEQNRNQYKTFASFYPEIIKFFAATADSIEDKKAAYEAKMPVVLDLAPFENYSTGVDPATTTLTIRFSDVMAGKGYSFNYGRLGKAGYPIKKVVGYAADKKSITVELALSPNTKYEFVLSGIAFKSTEGYPLKRYTVTFQTRE